MKIVIVGCGRVGSTLAESLDSMGHEVILFDVRTAAFDRLPETFKGAAIRGDGTDEEVLRQAGAEGADIFLSLTEGDNRNIMAAQVAEENLGIPRVIAKINDPVRAAAYADLGLVTLCRTNLMVDSMSTYLGLPILAGPGIEQPSTDHSHPHLPPGPRGRPAPAPNPTGIAPVGGDTSATNAGAGSDGVDEMPGAPRVQSQREVPAPAAPTERPATPRVFRRWRG